MLYKDARCDIFQSTLPMRGVTNHNGDCIVNDGISIHTPHAGSDSPKLCSMRLSAGFQSTLPMRGVTHQLISERGERIWKFQSTLPMRGVTKSDYIRSVKWLEFQSTLPMRGVTRPGYGAVQRTNISIHTPHAGSDECVQGWRGFFKNFNPHSPCGE